MISTSVQFPPTTTWMIRFTVHAELSKGVNVSVNTTVVSFYMEPCEWGVNCLGFYCCLQGFVSVLCKTSVSFQTHSCTRWQTLAAQSRPASALTHLQLAVVERSDSRPSDLWVSAPEMPISCGQTSAGTFVSRGFHRVPPESFQIKQRNRNKMSLWWSWLVMVIFHLLLFKKVLEFLIKYLVTCC